MFYGKDGTFYYFATSGPGLERKSLWDIINWHIPVSYQDVNMTFSKLFSRKSNYKQYGESFEENATIEEVDSGGSSQEILERSDQEIARVD